MNIRNQLATIACVGVLVFAAGCSSNQLPGTESKSTHESTQVTTQKETGKATNEMSKLVYYIPAEDGSGVKRVTKETSDSITPKAALQAMLKADRAQEYPTFPKDVDVISVTVKDGIASVEVNKAFVEGRGGDLAVKLQMAAIVNTLTSFDTIKGVLFVENGKKVSLVGSFDTEEPLKRMESYIKQ